MNLFHIKIYLLIVLIDGRELTKKFYESEFKKRGWSDTHIKFQEITWMIEDGEGG